MWIDDELLLQCEKPSALSIWIPKTPIVVVGNSNKIERECYQERCNSHHVPVLRRYGGGGAVVLHPQTVVVSFATWVKDYYNNKKYFDKINSALIDCLAEKWPLLEKLSLMGISDIAYDLRKVVGTSLFRSRNYLLFQASVLAGSGIEYIETYLKHPSTEPDYRKGKCHRDFIIGIDEIIPSATAGEVAQVFSENFLKIVKLHLASDLIDVQWRQCEHLLARRQKNLFPFSQSSFERILVVARED